MPSASHSFVALPSYGQRPEGQSSCKAAHQVPRERNVYTLTRPTPTPGASRRHSLLSEPSGIAPCQPRPRRGRRAPEQPPSPPRGRRLRPQRRRLRSAHGRPPGIRHPSSFPRPPGWAEGRTRRRRPSLPSARLRPPSRPPPRARGEGRWAAGGGERAGTRGARYWPTYHQSPWSPRWAVPTGAHAGEAPPSAAAARRERRSGPGGGGGERV